MRLAIVELLGWATAQGKATATGRRIARTDWPDLTPAARRVLERAEIVEGPELPFYPLRDTPYGEHPTDGDFTIGEVKLVGGGKRFGIIWYAGGESWGFDEFKFALATARRTAEEINSRSAAE